ncbi:MAG: M14 family zinc carboxypeptidase [Clostridia bacterium]|nr:M14 family zinc carboxypeptidase [Clostridia bacterium]
MKYDYKAMCAQCEQLCRRYSFVQMFCIGESVMKKPIYCLKIGKGEKKLLLVGAHHGLDYLTSALILLFFENYAKAFDKKERLLEYDVEALYERVSLYAVPMVNPDGVDIAANGPDVENKYHFELLRHVGMLKFEAVWQSNVRGVDIDYNYNIDWTPIAARPSPAWYAGPYSESEPETQALVRLARSLNFDMAIDFQGAGREIYYCFNGLTSSKSFDFARRFSEKSGYILAMPRNFSEAGSFAYWFVNEFKKEGFVIKIGYGQSPLPVSMIGSIYAENAPIILCALSSM